MKPRKVGRWMTFRQPIGIPRISSPRHASADASAAQKMHMMNMNGEYMKPATCVKPMRKVNICTHWPLEHVASTSPCRSSIDSFFFTRLILRKVAVCRAVPAKDPIQPLGTAPPPSSST